MQEVVAAAHVVLTPFKRLCAGQWGEGTGERAQRQEERSSILWLHKKRTPCADGVKNQWYYRSVCVINQTQNKGFICLLLTLANNFQFFPPIFSLSRPS